MFTKPSLPETNQAEHSLFITTRPSRNTQMPDASREIAARCMTERAWAEKHGMDMVWLMQSGTQPFTGTYTTSQGPNAPVMSDDSFSDAVPVGPGELM